MEKTMSNSALWPTIWLAVAASLSFLASLLIFWVEEGRRGKNLRFYITGTEMIPSSFACLYNFLLSCLDTSTSKDPSNPNPGWTTPAGSGGVSCPSVLRSVPGYPTNCSKTCSSEEASAICWGNWDWLRAWIFGWSRMKTRRKDDATSLSVWHTSCNPRDARTISPKRDVFIHWIFI